MSIVTGVDVIVCLWRENHLLKTFFSHLLHHHHHPVLKNWPMVGANTFQTEEDKACVRSLSAYSFIVISIRTNEVTFLFNKQFLFEWGHVCLRHNKQHIHAFTTCTFCQRKKQWQRVVVKGAVAFIFITCTFLQIKSSQGRSVRLGRTVVTSDWW